MREPARADRERGNSDMTVTNCLVFIQIVQCDLLAAL